jgi:hypothetical protein
MRVYLGGMSRPELKKARQLAPSHVFGVTWTPHDRRLSQIPFFIDNGAFTSSFDPEEWISLLDDVKDYSYRPDFVVLPDVLNDAVGTLERHREWASEVIDRDLRVASVVQPGMAVETQIRLADRIGADFVFLGGATRWQRSHGHEIIEQAHDRGLCVHIGNPSGKDGFTWAYKAGADSVDTSSVGQNGYWHYLEKLEQVTKDHSNRGGLKKKHKQTNLGEMA